MRPTKDHFAQASRELDQGMVDRGLWAMAFAQSCGDDALAAAIYLRLRAEALARDDLRQNIGKAVDATRSVADMPGRLIGSLLGPFHRGPSDVPCLQDDGESSQEELASPLPHAPRCVGVDRARHGWIAVWEAQGVLAFDVYSDPAEIWSAHQGASCIAVDIPIGLSDHGPRAADVEARRFVGGQRASSIFSAPVRPILDATTQPEASRRHREIDGRGFGAQAFAILAHIRTWDAFLTNCFAARAHVFEVHPEVSFAALNNGTGIAEPKKSADGATARKALLAREFGEERVRCLLARCPRNVAGPDDVLDALVALWTAQRIAAGTALTLPPDPPVDSAGITTAIHY